MLDLIATAIGLAAQPAALIGCVALGVWARTMLHAIGYAAVWALAMQLFVTVTGSGFANPQVLAIQFVLRLVGAAVVTAAVYLLYRFLRRTGSGNSGGRGPGRGGPGGGRPAQRPSHLRRVK